uniref:Uncharacterized protein n=1 Tax=Panagrolaimus sp. JU765 TaxID=591449 RepID=A0AC34PUR5_9BILA
MMSNKIPHLRFHRRSLSARDPQSPEEINGQKQHRRLPDVPVQNLTNPQKNEHEFIRNENRSRGFSFSPSEERIKRNQQQNFVKSGSTPRFSSGPILPDNFGNNLSPKRSLSGRASPKLLHAPDNNLLPPSETRHTSFRRYNFRQTHQRSMGQIDSRVNGNHVSREKPPSFNSFDGTNAKVGSKPKPQRFDSTASEDSVSAEYPEDKSKFGSSGSLDYPKNLNKKSITDSRVMQRNQRSSSNSKTSLTMKGPITSPKMSNGKKLAPISSSSQAIILYCMENSRGDIASRIITRMAHKRDDFASFCANMSPEQWNEFIGSLRTYLNDVVAHLQSSEKIREISMYFGINQVPRRSIGFKADYFAVMANSLTTECVFLDGAAHQPTEAIEAWAELVELMFSNVRDGYYQQIRYLRRNSQCFNAMFSQSSDQSTDGSDLPPVAPSTTGTLIRQYSEMSLSQNNLEAQTPSPHQTQFF